jgi:hypothetical protein
MFFSCGAFDAGCERQFNPPQCHGAGTVSEAAKGVCGWHIIKKKTERMSLMTKKQKDALDNLERKLGRKVPVIADTDDGLFIEVSGVTAVTEIIVPKGAYKVPALRHYDEGLETAADAPRLWGEQKRRDDEDPVKARQHGTGHLNPVVGTNLKCGDKNCRCQKESDDERKERSFGRRSAKGKAA